MTILHSKTSKLETTTIHTTSEVKLWNLFSRIYWVQNSRQIFPQFLSQQGPMLAMTTMIYHQIFSLMDVCSKNRTNSSKMELKT